MPYRQFHTDRQRCCTQHSAAFGQNQVRQISCDRWQSRLLCVPLALPVAHNKEFSYFARVALPLPVFPSLPETTTLAEPVAHNKEFSYFARVALALPVFPSPPETTTLAKPVAHQSLSLPQCLG